MKWVINILICLNEENALNTRNEESLAFEKYEMRVGLSLPLVPACRTLRSSSGSGVND